MKMGWKTQPRRGARCDDEENRVEIRMGSRPTRTAMMTTAVTGHSQSGPRLLTFRRGASCQVRFEPFGGCLSAANEPVLPHPSPNGLRHLLRKNLLDSKPTTTAVQSRRVPHPRTPRCKYNVAHRAYFKCFKRYLCGHAESLAKTVNNSSTLNCIL